MGDTMYSSDYKGRLGQRIIEKYNIEGSFTDLSYSHILTPTVNSYYLNVPLYIRLFKENTHSFFLKNLNSISYCVNYMGFVVRLSYTPFYIYFYAWPGDDDDFKNICQNGGGVENLRKILNYLKININFANKYNLK